PSSASACTPAGIPADITALLNNRPTEPAPDTRSTGLAGESPTLNWPDPKIRRVAARSSVTVAPFSATEFCTLTLNPTVASFDTVPGESEMKLTSGTF